MSDEQIIHEYIKDLIACLINVPPIVVMAVDRLARKASFTVPPGYRKMAESVSCRCINQFTAPDGSKWCCGENRFKPL